MSSSASARRTMSCGGPNSDAKLLQADPDIHSRADRLLSSGKFVHGLNKHGHMLGVDTGVIPCPD